MSSDPSWQLKHWLEMSGYCDGASDNLPSVTIRRAVTDAFLVCQKIPTSLGCIQASLIELKPGRAYMSQYLHWSLALIKITRDFFLILPWVISK